MVSEQTAWTPPTMRPQPGQGPWCDPDGHQWWIVAEHPDHAVAALRDIDADVLPDYFGWRLIVEPVLIRWVDPEEWNEETEIVECLSDYPWHSQAWKLTVENT